MGLVSVSFPCFRRCIVCSSRHRAYDHGSLVMSGLQDCLACDSIMESSPSHLREPPADNHEEAKHDADIIAHFTGVLLHFWRFSSGQPCTFHAAYHGECPSHACLNSGAIQWPRCQNGIPGIEALNTSSAGATNDIKSLFTASPGMEDVQTLLWIPSTTPSHAPAPPDSDCGVFAAMYPSTQARRNHTEAEDPRRKAPS